MATVDLDLGAYQLGWHDEIEYAFTPRKGLDEDEIVELGSRVMELKARFLAAPDPSPYDRPQRVRRMLIELSGLMDFVAWPVVRVVAHLRT